MVDPYSLVLWAAPNKDDIDTQAKFPRLTVASTIDRKTETVGLFLNGI